MKVELKSITPNCESTIVEIARVSSTRKDKTANPEGLIKYLIDNNHWSPFEMASICFEIETSKAIGIQLLRHRSFSFQEFSQRYAEVQSFEPIEFRKQCENNRQSSTEVLAKIDGDGQTFNGDDGFELLEIVDAINENLLATMDLYNALLINGIAKECARMILPMCSTTTIYMSGTVRSWLHFLAIRTDEHSQKEMQIIANEIKKIFIQELPIISKALGYEN
jgi:thymidylate synthase (FAD)